MKSIRVFLSLIILCVASFRASAQCTADAGPDLDLTCYQPSATLQGTGSVGPLITYLWTTVGGSFTSGNTTLTPTVDQPGTYCLLVTDVSSGCTATDCVVVTEGVQSPTHTLSAASTLDCIATTVQLTATPVIPGNYTYLWTGPMGWTGAIQNPLAPNPGSYCVMVTDINGCTFTDCVIVNGDVSTPTVAITPPPALNCASPVITLSASASGGSQFTYAWTAGGGGHIIAGAQTLNPIIDSPGNYCVEVYNTVNGCSATACVTVLMDINTPVCLINVPSEITCANPQIQLDASPSSTGPNYIYLWTTTNGHLVSNVTEKIATVDAPGFYQFKVMDTVTQCTSVAAVQVTAAAEVPTANCGPGIITLDCFSTHTPPLNCNISGGAAPYSVNWTGGIIDSPTGVFQLPPLAPGLYSATISDATGCTSVMAPFSIVAPAPIFVTILSNDPLCGSYDLTAVATGGLLPFSFQWSTGQSVPSIQVTSFGNYTVTVTDATGCSGTAMQQIDVNAEQCSLIKGFVFIDANSNCENDVEPPLGGFSAVATNATDTLYGVVDNNGFFEINAPPGDYLVTFTANPDIWEPCLPGWAASLIGTQDTFEIEAPMKVLNYCPVMTVDIATPMVRRCFPGIYQVDYCNSGSVPAIDAYLEVKLDSFLLATGAGMPFTTQPGNVLRFDLGTVNPGFCGYFWITFQVSCDAVLGQTHCSQAHIYPDSACAPNFQWSGASVQVAAQCDGDSVRFYIQNTAPIPMSGDLEYVVIEDGVMFMQAQTDPLDASEILSVAYPANGSTWRLETNQELYHPSLSNPTVTVEGCTVTGSFSIGYAMMFPPGDPDPWLDIECTVNQGSFDPNDKQGFPRGVGDENYIQPGTDIEYLIRFQNTGTDTAFTVVVRDTLSLYIDPATVRPGPSSHAYDFDLYGPGILKFSFENILLPDSNVNEPASHGFVRFTARPRAGTALPFDVYNSAAIYFDFNDPVITNITHHRVDTAFLTVAALEPSKLPYTVTVTPNPFGTEAVVELQGPAPAPSDARLVLYDLLGQPVLETRSATGRFVVRRGALAEGLYGFRIDSSGVQLSAGKVVVR